MEPGFTTLVGLLDAFLVMMLFLIMSSQKYGQVTSSVCVTQVTLQSPSATMNDNDNPFQVHADFINHYDPSDLNRKISNEQRFVVSAPPQQSTYIPRSSTNFSPIATRNILPDVARKTAQQKEKFAKVQLTRGYDGSKESNARLFASLQESAESVTSRTAPNTLAKRALVVARWNAMLSQYQPDWSEEIYWHFGVVYDNAKLFLSYLVCFSIDHLCDD